MSNVAEILRKADHLNGETVTQKNEEFLTYYKLGRKYFLKGDYRNAEYWWNKGVRKGCKKSKKALISLELHKAFKKGRWSAQKRTSSVLKGTA